MKPLNLPSSHSDKNSSAPWWSLSFMGDEYCIISIQEPIVSSQLIKQLIKQLPLSPGPRSIYVTQAQVMLSSFNLIPQQWFSLPKDPADIGAWTTARGEAGGFTQSRVWQALNPCTQPGNGHRFDSWQQNLLQHEQQSRERTLGKEPLAEYLDLPLPIISLQCVHCWHKWFLQKDEGKKSISIIS